MNETERLQTQMVDIVVQMAETCRELDCSACPYRWKNRFGREICGFTQGFEPYEMNEQTILNATRTDWENESYED
jgi:hypothetical protein